MTIRRARRPRRGRELARQIDEACDRFEADWKAGRRPRIEDYLAGVPGPGRPALLRELLELELAYRRKGGERPTAGRVPARGSRGTTASIDEAFGEGAPAPPRGRPAPAGPGPAAMRTATCCSASWPCRWTSSAATP